MKKYLLLSILGLGIFFIPKFSFASIGTPQYNDNSSSTQATGNGVFEYAQYLQFNATDTITTIVIETDEPWRGNAGGAGSYTFREWTGGLGGGGGNECAKTSETNTYTNFVMSTTTYAGKYYVKGVTSTPITVHSSSTGWCYGIWWTGSNMSPTATATIWTADTTMSAPYLPLYIDHGGTWTKLSYPGYYNFDGFPTDLNPSISFAFPTNGTTTAMFDNFWVTASNLNTSTMYTIMLTYDWDMTFDNPINSPQFANGTGQSLLHQGRLFPYQPFMGSSAFGTTRGVSAQAYLYSYDDCYGSNLSNASCTVLASASTSFFQWTADSTSTYIYVNPVIPTSTTSSTAGTYNTTTTPYQGYSGNPTNPWIDLTKNNQGYCKSPGDWTDIGGGIVYALCNVFMPPPGAENMLISQFNGLKNDFPFSIVFQTLAEAQANATTTTGNYDLYFTIPSTSTSIPILTSTTLEMAIGSSSKAMVFTTEKQAVWLFTGIAILLLII